MKKENGYTEITNLPAEALVQAGDDLYEHHRIVVDKGQDLLRIDKFLVDRLPHATRNKIQNAIKCDAIKVNEVVIKSNYKVKPQDIITVSLPNPPRDEEIIPEDIPLNIIFEDNDIIVINKPAGMVMHPAHNNWTGTLVNALAYYFQNPKPKSQIPNPKSQIPKPKNQNPNPKSEIQNPKSGIGSLVHRIDKDTSGLVVVAKSELALAHLAKQFFEHTIERTYLALVWGRPSPTSPPLTPPQGGDLEGASSSTITGNIGRSLKDRRVMAVFPEGNYGKPAVTHFVVLKSFQYVSLIQCNLETGRTHQIRAHLKYIGHPLFNDAVYGGDKIVKGPQFSKYQAFVKNCFKKLPRQALHAKSLGFIHPGSKKQVRFECELAEDFKAVLQKWEQYSVDS